MHDPAPDRSHSLEGAQSGLAAAAAAQSAFAEASSMLEEFTGGAPLIQVEWHLVQQLARQAAHIFDDLAGWHAESLEIPLPRRWWEPRWTAGDFTPPLPKWAWQRTPRTHGVDQFFVTGRIDEAPDEADDEHFAFFAEAYLVGRDGVLRYGNDYFHFARAQYPSPPLAPGVIGPADPQWDILHRLGAISTVVDGSELGIDTTEQLLNGFARMAAATRDAMASRIARLRESGVAPLSIDTPPPFR